MTTMVWVYVVNLIWCLGFGAYVGLTHVEFWSGHIVGMIFYVPRSEFSILGGMNIRST